MFEPGMGDTGEVGCSLEAKAREPNVSKSTLLNTRCWVLWSFLELAFVNITGQDHHHNLLSNAIERKCPEVVFPKSDEVCL